MEIRTQERTTLRVIPLLTDTSYLSKIEIDKKAPTHKIDANSYGELVEKKVSFVQASDVSAYLVSSSKADEYYLLPLTKASFELVVKTHLSLLDEKTRNIALNWQVNNTSYFDLFDSFKNRKKALEVKINSLATKDLPDVKLGNFHLSYDALNISILSESANWTEFGKVTFLKTEKTSRERFSYTHGSSSSFNDDTKALEMIKKTQDMLKVIERLYLFQDIIFEELKILSKFDFELSFASNELEISLHSYLEALNNRELEEREDLEKISFDECMERLSKDNALIKITYPTLHGICSNEVSNRSSSKLNLYLGDSKITKKDFAMFVESKSSIYIAK